MLPPRYLADRRIGLWPHDSGPGAHRNNTRRDGVGRASEPTRHALKTRLRRTISLCHMPAGQACLRGMPRIHPHYRHTSCLRFVLHEGAQLSKGPIGVTRSLPTANRAPFANAPEVLKAQSTAGVFGGAHQRLADAVVHVALKACLASTQPLELALGSSRLLALKIAPTVAVSSSLSLDRFAGVRATVRIGSQLDNPQVHSQIVPQPDRLAHPGHQASDTGRTLRCDRPDQPGPAVDRDAPPDIYPG